MKKSLSIIFLFFSLISCQDNIMDTVEENNYQPLDEIEISEGNVWNSTTVLPDTGDIYHFVSTLDMTFNDSNYFFVATDFAGIFRSKNQGISWTSQNYGFNSRELGNGDIFYLTSAVGCLGTHTFAGTDSAIYVSKNYGENWNISKKWNDYHLITTFKPKNKGELYVGCYHGILKTDNFGNSWQDISVDFDWNRLGYAYDLEFTTIGTLYVATVKGLARTYNDGKDWEYFGIQDQTLDVEVSGNGYIYAAIDNKLFLSKDDGITWDPIFDQNSFISSLLVNKANTIFVCCNRGIYRSKNDGQSWEMIGLQNLTPKKIFYDKYGNLVVATFRKGVFISYN